MARRSLSESIAYSFAGLAAACTACVRCISTPAFAVGSRLASVVLHPAAVSVGVGVVSYATAGSEAIARFELGVTIAQSACGTGNLRARHRQRPLATGTDSTH